MMKNKEIKGFQSEVKQLLKLMIHSLYSNKEIFLRELISNASDAVDRLQFCALSDSKLYENEKNFRVRISYDKNERLIIIEDNGIGMTRKEVEENLGTIAKSGTKLFLSSVDSKELKKNDQLIGQFGVGFYSSFIVAKKVIVKTRYAGLSKNQGVFWESSGEENYNIADITKESRGTEVSLFLRDEEEEFLDEWRLKNIIRKYSDNIDLPIEMKIEKKEEKDNNKYIIGSYSWEKINKAEALWTRNKKEITEVEYKEFYKYMFHDFDDPLIWSHNKVEGKQEYISLLYIPKKLPWEVWNREQKNNGIKLYAQKVYIMDSVEQFLPNYLRFVRGLIDSNDFPLNVSREILQENNLTKHLKRTLTKRILSMLENLSLQDSSKYLSFWEEFGIILKEGIGEDPNNKEIISNLLRFSSTYEKQKYVSFSDYLSRMSKSQKNIYYIVADNYISAKNSPHLEIFQKEKIEVLLLYDQIDEWMMNHLRQFKDIPIQLISKSDSVFNSSLEKKEDQQDQETKEILEHFLRRVRLHFKNRLKEIRFTRRLVDTPVVLVTDKNDMSTQMIKLFSMSGEKNVPEIKYILEINPKHKLIRYISGIDDQILFAEWIELLFDQALLVEKGALEDSNKFIKRVNKLFSQSLNLEEKI